MCRCVCVLCRGEVIAKANESEEVVYADIGEFQLIMLYVCKSCSTISNTSLYVAAHFTDPELEF